MTEGWTGKPDPNHSQLSSGPDIGAHALFWAWEVSQQIMQASFQSPFSFLAVISVWPSPFSSVILLLFSLCDRLLLLRPTFRSIISLSYASPHSHLVSVFILLLGEQLSAFRPLRDSWPRLACKFSSSTAPIQVSSINPAYTHTHAHGLHQQAISVILTGGGPNLKPQAVCALSWEMCGSLFNTQSSQTDRQKSGKRVMCQWKAPSFLFHFLFIQMFIFGLFLVYFFFRF